MYVKSFISIIAVGLLMTGCSKKENSVEVNQAANNKEHILSEQKKSLDKAKQVEQMLIDGKNSRHNAMENQLK